MASLLRLKQIRARLEAIQEKMYEQGLPKHISLDIHRHHTDNNKRYSLQVEEMTSSGYKRPYEGLLWIGSSYSPRMTLGELAVAVMSIESGMRVAGAIKEIKEKDRSEEVERLMVSHAKLCDDLAERLHMWILNSRDLHETIAMRIIKSAIRYGYQDGNLLEFVKVDAGLHHYEREYKEALAGAEHRTEVEEIIDAWDESRRAIGRAGGHTGGMYQAAQVLRPAVALSIDYYASDPWGHLSADEIEQLKLEGYSQKRGA